MPLRSQEKKDAAAAQMRGRMVGSNAAAPPSEIPAYASAETLARLFDCSPDQAHKRFGHLPGVVNIGTGKSRACRRYPMAEVERELERLRCSG